MREGNPQRQSFKYGETRSQFSQHPQSWSGLETRIRAASITPLEMSTAEDIANQLAGRQVDGVSVTLEAAFRRGLAMTNPNVNPEDIQRSQVLGRAVLERDGSTDTSPGASFKAVHPETHFVPKENNPHEITLVELPQPFDGQKVFTDPKAVTSEDDSYPQK